MKFAAGALAIAVLVNMFALVVNLDEKWKLREENAALKVKIVEWQYHAFTAVEARGWLGEHRGVEDTRDITPEVLGYALNPCYLTPSGNVDHFNPNCLKEAAGK